MSNNIMDITTDISSSLTRDELIKINLINEQLIVKLKSEIETLNNHVQQLMKENDELKREIQKCHDNDSNLDQFLQIQLNEDHHQQQCNSKSNGLNQCINETQNNGDNDDDDDDKFTFYKVKMIKPHLTSSDTIRKIKKKSKKKLRSDNNRVIKKKYKRNDNTDDCDYGDDEEEDDDDDDNDNDDDDNCDDELKKRKKKRKSKIIPYQFHQEDDGNGWICDWPGCGRLFKSQQAIFGHFRHHSTPSADPKFPPKPEKLKYLCGINGCEHRCISEKSLRNHKVHRHNTGERPFACEWPNCGTKMRSLYAIKMHMRTHTGEKPWMCEWPGCGHRTADKKRLKVHLRTHTGEKPYKCVFPACDKAFIKKENLTLHERNHTNEKPYKCCWPGCDKAYKKDSHMKDHYRKHTGERNFVCDLSGCTSRFFNIYRLKMHKLKIHGIEYKYESK